MKAINYIIILIFFTIFSCNENKEDSNSMIGEWILTSIQEKSSNQLIFYPDSIPRYESITFVDSTSILLFNGICNQGQGKYIISDNSLIFPEGIGITKILCKYVIWEEYLYSNLIESSNYYFKNNQLIIQTTGSYNLIFKKKTN